jgi:hypothetical protein
MLRGTSEQMRNVTAASAPIQLRARRRQSAVQAPEVNDVTQLTTASHDCADRHVSQGKKQQDS